LKTGSFTYRDVVAGTGDLESRALVAGGATQDQALELEGTLADLELVAAEVQDRRARDTLRSNTWI
jgi:hypothetical protein